VSRPEDLLSANLEAGYRIGQRLIQAWQHLSEVLPLPQEVSVDDLSEGTTVWIDAFLKRWENFQDMLDGQIARGVIILEGETESVVTRRDRAAFLEKMALAPSAEEWFDAGQLRNQLVHSYPLSNPKQKRRLNFAYQYTGLLINTYNRLREHVESRGLAPVTVPQLSEVV
jgi:hypothetical protein